LPHSSWSNVQTESRRIFAGWHLHHH